jgi:hypothetical protein
MTGADPSADRVLILGGGGLAGVAGAQKLGDEGSMWRDRPERGRQVPAYTFPANRQDLAARTSSW